MDVSKVRRYIEKYRYYSVILAELQDMIASTNPKTTATYGQLSGFGGGGISDETAEISIRRNALRVKAAKISRKLANITRLIEHSGLTEREKGVMWCIANSGNLQVHARRERIGKDNVYKIRDRALKKIADRLQNVQ